MYVTYYIIGESGEPESSVRKAAESYLWNELEADCIDFFREEDMEVVPVEDLDTSDTHDDLVSYNDWDDTSPTDTVAIRAPAHVKPGDGCWRYA